MSKQKVRVQFEKFRISRFDEKNIVLEELVEGGINPKTREKASDKWMVVGYYGQLKHVVSALVNRSIEVPHADSLDEQLNLILAELKRVETSLLAQLKVIE